MSVKRSNSIALDEVAVALSGFGARGKSELEILGTLVHYLDKVVNTEVGKDIIIEDVERWRILAAKCIRGKIDIDEKSELEYITRRLDKLANKLYEYNDLHNKVVDKLEKEKHNG